MGPKGASMKQLIDDVITIENDGAYAVCLNLDLPNPDNPELIVISGKSLIAALESCDWVETTEQPDSDTRKKDILANIDLAKRYITGHKQHLLDLVDGVPYSDEIGKRVIRRHCENLDFDLRILDRLNAVVDNDKV
jgi:hypothetical protein